MAKKTYPAEALEKLAKRLNGGFDIADTLILASSAMLTVMYKKGRYKKLPFIGGERFNFENVWVGKRGQLIFCFTPGYGTDQFRIMELTQNQIARLFPPLDQALTAFLGCSIEQYLEAYAEVYSEQAEAKAEQERRDNYGQDWGQFG